MWDKNKIQTGGCHRSIDSKSRQGDYTISLPILHPNAVETAKNIGCTIEKNKIIGTVEKIEAFMFFQNPLFQSKYNCSKYLNGAWNPLSYKLEMILPKPQTGKILMSASTIRSDKTVSTGFMPVVYADFNQLGEAMHLFAHSSSIYCPINRWDKYKGEMKWDFRRRLHNISYIGNILVYDFDKGSLSFRDAVSLLQNNNLRGLIIRSKSDPKYNYDRFKLMIQTDMFFPIYQKDEAPDGFQKVAFIQYKNIYIGFAKKYGFWDFADHSTVDPSRLIAQVNNADHERREYVAV